MLRMILPLLFLTSCMVKEAETQQPGAEIRNFENLSVSSADNTNVQSICKALINRENILFVLANNRYEYTFNVAQKNCEATSAAPAKDIVTTIVGGGVYTFQAKNGEVFPFGEVDTYSKGLMADLCKNVGAVTNPFRNSMYSATWFSTADNKFCRSDASNICILIETGTSEDPNTDTFKIVKREWVKFNIKDKEGFFTFRKFSTVSGCQKGSLEITASLK